MLETPMLFPVNPAEFLKKIRTLVEEVVEQKLNAMAVKESNPSLLPEKPLLKASDVCRIFQVSKPTLYEWMKQGRLKSFKVRSRRYFSREEIQLLIRQINPSS